ncbi:MAG: hypothetical protein H0X39_00610 [Actinobacteria bacterium]|nr:hypothetical protein [Actinomycetota bacterium]
MRRTGALVVALAAVASTAVTSVAAAPTGPTSAKGSVSFHWSRGTTESGTLTYAISGPIMNGSARDRYVPPAYPAGYRPPLNLPTYFRATLTSFSYRVEMHDDCADGTTADTAAIGAGITDRRAVLSHFSRLELDLLRARGVSAIAPDARYRWVNGGIVHDSQQWRGLGEVSIALSGAGCPESTGPRRATVRVDQLIPRGVLIDWSSERTLPVRVLPDGSLALRSAWSSTTGGDGYASRLTANLRLHGALRGLGAFCTWPTNAQLAGARSVEQAQSVVRHAGLVTRFGGDRANAYVAKGHFYIQSGSSTSFCGVPAGTLLYRSLGRS